MEIPPVDNAVLLAGDESDTITPLMLREAIDAARVNRGWSVNKLATAAGVPQSRLSDYFAGKATIHSDHVDKLLATLGLNFKRPPAKPRTPPK